MCGAESYSYRCTHLVTILLLFNFLSRFFIVPHAKFLSTLQSVNSLTSLSVIMLSVHSVLCRWMFWGLLFSAISRETNTLANLLLTFCWKVHFQVTSVNFPEYWNVRNTDWKTSAEQSERHWCACNPWSTRSAVWVFFLTEWGFLV